MNTPMPVAARGFARRGIGLLCLALLFSMLPLGALAATASKLVISQAALSAAGKLSIAGTAPSAASVELYDVNGRRLWAGAGGAFSVALAPDQLPTAPCAVRAVAGNQKALAKVQGAPASCAKVPSCRITGPASGVKTALDAEVKFKAIAKLKDKRAAPLKLEWDFGGGSVGEPVPGNGPATYQRPGQLKATARFLRGNSRHRVRFSATDALGRRCEDAVEVAVGHPPDALPGKVPEQAAPALGGAARAAPGGLVVLPVEEWSFQCVNDHYQQPNISSVFPWAVENLHATVYRKDRLPAVVDDGEVDLAYSAASNPADPVGAGSINSTSQNWPLGAYVREADIAKTDLWERVDRRGQEALLAADYQSRTYMWFATGLTFRYPLARPAPDEGVYKPELNADGHGSYMPGIAAPYTANDPQPLPHFDADSGRFSARFLPLSDVDDQNRINPYPLLRVQVLDKATKAPLAATDAVLTNGRDMHCRQCHAKGQIAADPAAPWTREAYHASLNGESCSVVQFGLPPVGCVPQTPEDWRKPVFVEPKSADYREQEWAAAWNILQLHDFYDYIKAAKDPLTGQTESDGRIHKDGSGDCDECHGSPLRHWPFSSATVPFALWNRYFSFEKYGSQTSQYYTRTETQAVHGLHGRLQLNPDGSLMRDHTGRPELWDTAQGSNPNTLFPVVDKAGHSLPMEQNCLRCHAGQRERCYRDRMEAAGVTCYDCHGDMLAVGLSYPKPAALVTAEGNHYRVAWYEQPTCGACHTGDANQGQDGQGGFFSAGVLRRAFAADDPSATPLPPRSERFAVLPVRAYAFPQVGAPVAITTAAYRDGRDTHGNVPCVACHGGAHAVWPNRDPSANDNVTALELQGHAGQLLECTVCHTADAFRLKGDLDGGTYSGDTKAGILGGPHNLHPVNDPYWWSQAPGDTPNQSDGTTKGGWHNNYARQPGKDGEDQCAACHGQDHLGTRLSKTPVDRAFIDEKGKPVKVNAGTAIGCNLCHTVAKSCAGSPAGAQCGPAKKPSAAAE